MKTKKSDRLILVTNDDGYDAPGIEALITVMKDFGKVVVVAPIEAQSGMSHAITIKVPLRLIEVKRNDGVKMYKCSGTPVDCVKIAIDKLLNRKPDLLASGINHGINSSVSVFYSGTIAAAMEGALNDIPAMGFSLNNLKPDADFTASIEIARKITAVFLKKDLFPGKCININIPRKPLNEIKGIKVCRQAHGMWIETFDKRTDPNYRDYYWLTGSFMNYEKEAKDTDEWALRNGYATIVPMQTDLTCYESIQKMKDWKF